MLMDPEHVLTQATHTVLHAWITTYLASPQRSGGMRDELAATALETQAYRLRESALQLAAALAKMRLANERLAARMAEHRAFFAKYKTE